MDEKGPITFLAYAAGCIPLRVEREVLDAELAALLTKCNEEKTPPSVEHLRAAFPNAVESLYRYASVRSLDPWSYVAVSRYWRTEHSGATPVWQARFVKTLGVVNGQNFMQVQEQGSPFTRLALNPRQLALVEGVAVLIHVQTIAELLEPTV